MVYVLLGPGFEEVEAITPVDLLRRAGVEVRTVGINGKTVYGSHHIGIEADMTLDMAEPGNMEMLVLPGGLGGVASIEASAEALSLIRYAYENNKFIGAICAAPTILGKMGILEGKQAVCYPGCEEGMGNALVDYSRAAVQSGKVITGTSAGCAVAFALALIEALKGDREAERIARQIVIR